MNARGSCGVCDHPDLRNITADLLARRPYKEIEKRYSVDDSVICEHVKNHVERGIKMLIDAERPSLAVQNIADADAVCRPVLGQLRALHVRTLAILKSAEDEKDRSLALASVREARRNLELLARLTGELDPRAASEERNGPLIVQYVTVTADKREVNGAAGAKTLELREGGAK